MAMTRAQFARDLETGVNAHFGMTYDSHETEYTEDQVRTEIGEAGMRVGDLISRWGEYWAEAAV